MHELYEAINWLINDTIFDEIMGLVSTFLTFVLSFAVFFSPKVKISDKILIGVNYSRFRDQGEFAWKFKIVNKSILVSFFEFDIKLTGIKYKTIGDGSSTEHRKSIEIIAGIRELTRYELCFITFIKRKINPNYTISYAYRPLTYENLNEVFNEYDKLELSVKYTDSLIGRIHHTKKYFIKTTITQGDFTNDGRLNHILKNDISECAWQNHLESKMDK